MTERDGDRTTTRTVEAEGYDPAFWAEPGSEEGKKVHPEDGKYDVRRRRQEDRARSRHLAPRGCARQARGRRRSAWATSGCALGKVKEDLIGGTDGGGPKLDAARYLDNADAINQRLTDANADVAAAQAGLNSKYPAGFIGPVATPTTPETGRGAGANSAPRRPRPMR